MGSYIWPGESGKLYLVRARWVVVFGQGKVGSYFLARANLVVTYGQGKVGSYFRPGQSG